MAEIKEAVSMREKLFNIVERAEGENRLSQVYDVFMMVTIFVSIVPLAFRAETSFFFVLDKITVAIFIVDYLLRLVTADYKYGRHTVGSFLRYPFSFLAVVDLVSILPSLTLLNSGFKLLKIFRLFRTFRVFRVFKTLRYSKNIRILTAVLRNSKESLIAVGTLAVAYVLISALVIFNVEPQSFETFFDAVYWATVSLTTVGYGDIYPVTTLGRMVTMVSSVFGIAIIALPAGIITAGYMQEIEKK
jgi:voltage-gated potassium channel